MSKLPTESDVLIVGAGPTSLTLAAELALAGVSATIVERRKTPDLESSRAGGLHARTIELFGQRGIADRFLAAGRTAQVTGFAWMPLEISDFPTRHPYGLALPQPGIERILNEWAAELRIRVHRGCEVSEIEAGRTGVAARFANGHELRARYLVGCDGGSSLVRKSAGIGFPGTDATISHIIAEAEMTDPPEMGLRRNERGLFAISPIQGTPRLRIMVTERETRHTNAPDIDDLRSVLAAEYGSDCGVHSATWISRFNDVARQADSYRSGRILLAGDAAHVHHPVGGQGLNIGVHDAMNLGWKLGRVVRRIASKELLDTYHAERHPIAARVLDDTRAQVELLRFSVGHEALRTIVADLLETDEARKRIAGRMSGLDLRYGSHDGHALLGRRMPDLTLQTGDGKTRVCELLHEARPVFLSCDGFDTTAIGNWPDSIATVEATTSDTWDLPVIGRVTAPRAVLVRPDGYVAWVSLGDDHGLESALREHFGPPYRARKVDD